MKTAIVYSSTTGNTEQLANAIKEAAPDAYFSTADVADPSEVLSAELILLGSPAMGAEQLEDSMEEFFSGIQNGMAGEVKFIMITDSTTGNGEVKKEEAVITTEQ